MEVDGEIIWQVNGGRARSVILRENSVSVHPGLPFAARRRRVVQLLDRGVQLGKGIIDDINSVLNMFHFIRPINQL